MHKYTFNFKNVTYACVGESDEECAFNLMQFQHCIDTGDWVTLNNRIIGQLNHYVEIVDGVREVRSSKKVKSKKVAAVKPPRKKVDKINSFW
jgi:hypothetical protein